MLAGVKWKNCQFGFRQETQRQVGLVFHQRQAVFFLSYPVDAVVAHQTVPLYHIFKVQEQVGYGAAFFVAVTIPAVVGSGTQTLHEFCGGHIGGAGEGGDAVVTVERAVIEGLGVGHFCAVEQIRAVIQHLDFAKQGSGVIFALGIVVIGNGKSAEEQRGVQHQLQRHGGGKGIGRPCPAAGDVALPHQISFDGARFFLGGAAQRFTKQIIAAVGNHHAHKVQSQERKIK